MHIINPACLHIINIKTPQFPKNSAAGNHPSVYALM